MYQFARIFSSSKFMHEHDHSPLKKEKKQWLIVRRYARCGVCDTRYLCIKTNDAPEDYLPPPNETVNLKKNVIYGG